MVRDIYDTQCGFKLISKQAREQLTPLLCARRWALDVELLALAKKHGHKIKKIPVRWVNDPNTRVGLKGYLHTLWEVALIKLRLVFGRYN